jgi:hypothetical protein
MVVNEYEERFCPPAPSLHEIFASTKGPSQKRRRRRIWLVAAAVGLLTIAYSAASHHALDRAGGHGRTTAAQGQGCFAVAESLIG